MSKAMLLIFGLAVLAYLPGATSESIDYLKVSNFDITPSETVDSGKPIASAITLERISTILPEEAKLNITVGMTNPIVTVDVDGDVQNFANEKEIEIPLPAAGVEKIEISVSGKAPTVERLTTVDMVTVRTYTRFTGTEGGYKKKITLDLAVTNPAIEEAVDAIAIAKSKRDEADRLIGELRAQGVDTVELETKLLDAKTLVARAESDHDAGRISDAKESAELATNLLTEIIRDANDIASSKKTRSNVVIYAVVIIAIAAILFIIFRRRGEELG